MQRNRAEETAEERPSSVRQEMHKNRVEETEETAEKRRA